MTDETAPTTIAQRLGPVQAGLRSDLEVTRHLFRGQPQYVVRDPVTFQTHQFSQQDYQILTALNDSLPLEEVFQNLVNEGRLAADQEEDFYQFILNLHRLTYLILPLADGKLLYERFASRQRAARWRQISGFLFLRVPLLNPDAFLDRTVEFVRPLFTRAAFALWMLMMCSGLWLLVRRWEAFKDPIHSILANETLLFIWFALIGLKVFHEFGHAYACKVFGGKVPEMGAFFIAFTPCAYMDASAAWGFSRLRHRVVVSLAGMYFESFIAFLALVVWSWTEDPLINSCAHHVVVLSSAVTIGFNINPLMRYDGYYVLSDLVGVPNLRQRSVQQVQAVLKRWLLGISPTATGTPLRERALLSLYGVATSCYKVLLILAICTMIALKFNVVGILLAAFFVVGILGGLLRRMFAYLWRSQETQPVRMRAIALSLVVVVLVPAGLTTVPIPGKIVVPGIVQTRDDKTVYAQVDGVLRTPQLPVGSMVRHGDCICQLQNIDLETSVAQMRAETEVARMQFSRSMDTSPHATVAARLHLAHAQERFERAQSDHDRLTIRAPISGKLTHAVDHRDTGRYVRKGEPIGTIAVGVWTVRCVATSEEIADTRPKEGQSVRVRLMLDGVHEVRGTVEEVAVKGSHKVFSTALTQLGGGEIAVDPQSLVTSKPMFEIVVRLQDADHLPLRHEGRATVSFDGEPQTYGGYAFRRLQQFLNRLRVR